MESINVRVVEFGDRKHYQMQYRDPLTGRKKTKSTGIARTGRKKERDAAEKAAGKWEAELKEGRFCAAEMTTWAAFRTRYESECLTGLAVGTDEKVQGVFNVLERIISPQKLRHVTAERLSHFQAKLREDGRAESTIASYLRHIKAALRWAVRMGMLAKAPEIERPKRAKGGSMMKGRPITREEFDRMLAKVDSVVNKELTSEWKRYLEGLWASGLRLSESLMLTWDEEGTIQVDMSGEYPVLKIPAEMEKGHKDRLLPMAPEFAQLLSRTPKAKRTGLVFQPMSVRGDKRVDRFAAMRIIGEIGRKARVKVASKPKDDGEVVKYASAHDLRRSFGERWAVRVMPQVLKELMRHESIETTLRFYVGRNAQNVAAVLWEAHQKATGNTSGNSRAFRKTAKRRK